MDMINKEKSRNIDISCSKKGIRLTALLSLFQNSRSSLKNSSFSCDKISRQVFLPYFVYHVVSLYFVVSCNMVGLGFVNCGYDFCEFSLFQDMSCCARTVFTIPI